MAAKRKLQSNVECVIVLQSEHELGVGRRIGNGLVRWLVLRDEQRLVFHPTLKPTALQTASIVAEARMPKGGLTFEMVLMAFRDPRCADNKMKYLNQLRSWMQPEHFHSVKDKLGKDYFTSVAHIDLTLSEDSDDIADEMELPKVKKMKFDDTKSEPKIVACVICSCDVAEETMRRCTADKDNHSACKDCISTWISGQIPGPKSTLCKMFGTCSGSFCLDDLNIAKSWRNAYELKLVATAVSMFTCAHCGTEGALDLNSYKFDTQICAERSCGKQTCTDCGKKQHDGPCLLKQKILIPHVLSIPRETLKCGHCLAIGAIDKDACLKSQCPDCKLFTCAWCGVALSSNKCSEDDLYSNHFCRGLVSDPIGVSCKHSANQPHCHLWPNVEASQNVDEQFELNHPELMPAIPQESTHTTSIQHPQCITPPTQDISHEPEKKYDEAQMVASLTPLQDGEWTQTPERNFDDAQMVAPLTPVKDGEWTQTPERKVDVAQMITSFANVQEPLPSDKPVKIIMKRNFSMDQESSLLQQKQNISKSLPKTDECENAQVTALQAIALWEDLFFSHSDIMDIKSWRDVYNQSLFAAQSACMQYQKMQDANQENTKESKMATHYECLVCGNHCNAPLVFDHWTTCLVCNIMWCTKCKTSSVDTCDKDDEECQMTMALHKC